MFCVVYLEWNKNILASVLAESLLKFQGQASCARNAAYTYLILTANHATFSIAISCRFRLNVLNILILSTVAISSLWRCVTYDIRVIRGLIFSRSILHATRSTGRTLHAVTPTKIESIKERRTISKKRRRRKRRAFLVSLIHFLVIHHTVMELYIFTIAKQAIASSWVQFSCCFSLLLLLRHCVLHCDA